MRWNHISKTGVKVKIGEGGRWVLIPSWPHPSGPPNPRRGTSPLLHLPCFMPGLVIILHSAFSRPLETSQEQNSRELRKIISTASGRPLGLWKQSLKPHTISCSWDTFFWNSNQVLGLWTCLQESEKAKQYWKVNEGRKTKFDSSGIKKAVLPHLLATVMSHIPSYHLTQGSRPDTRSGVKLQVTMPCKGHRQNKIWGLQKWL